MSFKVSFVDYSLENFHANKFIELLRGDLKHLGVDVACAWGMQEKPSRQWAKKHGVAWADTPEAAAQDVDGVFLLAPDNSEVHLELAERVFPAGKPTYVDKTFADSVSMAEAMIDLATVHDTPVFSTSALRYAPNLVQLMQSPTHEQLIDAASEGPAEWLRYGIHAVEPLVALFGGDVKRLRTGGQNALMRVEIEWRDGRTAQATVNGYGGVSFALRATTLQGSEMLDLNDGRFYNGLVDHIAQFMKTKQSPVPLADTLMIIKILEGALRSRWLDGAWIVP